MKETAINVSEDPDMRNATLDTERNLKPGGGGGGLEYVVIWGCAIILGTFWGLLLDFWVLFGLFQDFWVSFFGYSRICGCHFLIKFAFFQNNPDFGEMISIFPSMTLWNVACRALVSMILQFPFLFYYACAKSFLLSITATSLSWYICSAF